MLFRLEPNTGVGGKAASPPLLTPLTPDCVTTSTRVETREYMGWFHISQLKQGLDQKLAKFLAHNWQNVTQNGPTSAKVRQNIDRHWPLLDKFDQDWSNLAECWPELAKNGPTLADVDPNWPNLVEIHPSPAKFGPNRPAFGRNSSHVGIVGQVWPKIGKCRANLPNIGQCCWIAK